MVSLSNELWIKLVTQSSLMLLVNSRIMENPSCTFAVGSAVYWKAVAFHSLGKAFPGFCSLHQ